MKKFEDWILSRKVWINILIGFFSYGIWWIIWGFFAIKRSINVKPHTITKSDNNSIIEKKQNTFKAPLYEKRFTIIDSENFQDNIKKLVEIEKNNNELYDGMTGKEIKECGYDVYEVEGIETPEVILKENKGKSIHYISVCIYHSGFDRYLTVGKIPDNEKDEILKYFDKNVMIWGSFAGGKYKYVEGDSLKTGKDEYHITLHIKITDK